MFSGFNRKMFRRPGLARQAVGILASSGDLANTVQQQQQPTLGFAPGGMADAEVLRQVTEYVDGLGTPHSIYRQYGTDKNNLIQQIYESVMAGAPLPGRVPPASQRLAALTANPDVTKMGPMQLNIPDDVRRMQSQPQTASQKLDALTMPPDATQMGPMKLNIPDDVLQMQQRMQSQAQPSSGGIETLKQTQGPGFDPVAARARISMIVPALDKLRTERNELTTLRKKGAFGALKRDERMDELDSQIGQLETELRGIHDQQPGPRAINERLDQISQQDKLGNRWVKAIDYTDPNHPTSQEVKDEIDALTQQLNISREGFLKTVGVPAEVERRETAAAEKKDNGQSGGGEDDEPLWTAVEDKGTKLIGKEGDGGLEDKPPAPALENITKLTSSGERSEEEKDVAARGISERLGIDLDKAKEVADTDAFWNAITMFGLGLASGEGEGFFRDAAKAAMGAFAFYNQDKKDSEKLAWTRAIDKLNIDLKEQQLDIDREQLDIARRKVDLSEIPDEVRLLEYLNENPKAMKAYKDLKGKDATDKQQGVAILQGISGATTATEVISLLNSAAMLGGSFGELANMGNEQKLEWANRTDLLGQLK